MEVPADTSSKSPKPLSFFWGHPQNPALCISPVHACRSPYLPPARFVPLTVVAQTHALPPREPPQLKRSEKAATLRSGPQEGDTVQTPRPYL